MKELERIEKMIDKLVMKKLKVNNEKLENVSDEYDYYDDEIEYKTASISDMQKSSLSDILNFELR